MSGTGTQVLRNNRAALETVLCLLVLTTGLTDAYYATINCSLEGLATLDGLPPARQEGVAISADFLFGTYPYRYPKICRRSRRRSPSGVSATPELPWPPRPAPFAPQQLERRATWR
ncbi:hypothetical protein ACWDYH_24985 [Nocardia goodfellowii]